MKKLSSRDFRAFRHVLEPEDFALSDEKPDPPPADLIDAHSWQGLMALPDDVVIRTSSHHGRRLKALYSLWGEWIEATGTLVENWKRKKGRKPGHFLEWAMMDAGDDFQVATFNLIHGHYKQSIGLLRSALEIVVLGVVCRVLRDQARWRAWERGRGKGARIELKDERRRLENWCMSISDTTERAAALDLSTRVRTLYGKLSTYSHARSESMNSALWNSNGPIWVPQEFRRAAKIQTETYCLLFLLVKLVQPDLQIGKVSLREIKWRRPHEFWRKRFLP